MASPLATKRLQRELKALHKNPLSNPKIVAQPNESNILEWHYVLEGPADDPKSPYKGGIYHGKLIFPKEYPYKPPGVIMLTPNGRFKPNRRLCLSMSDVSMMQNAEFGAIIDCAFFLSQFCHAIRHVFQFHPETWNPMWSISTILMGLYSFMMDTKPTTGSIETTNAAKRQFAAESLKYNVKNDKNFCNLFPEYVEIWEKMEQERKAKLAELGVEDAEEEKAVASANVGEVNDFFAFGAGLVAVFSILFAILRFL
ncbi:hypothetical protein ACHAWF_006620 [Thalassiosira exigua]